jgi:hypothetical protein
MQGIVVCDIISHHLTDELASSLLFILMFLIKLTSRYKYIICALRNCNFLEENLNLNRNLNYGTLDL